MINFRFLASLLSSLAIALVSPLAIAIDSKILATGGVTQLEGAAGGGIVPWAVIAGYAQEGEVGYTLTGSRAVSNDFQLNVLAAAVGFNNRFELSYAKQSFDLGPLQRNLGLPSNTLKQDIFGAKVRVYGNLIYGSSPQFSLGIQHKRVDDFTIPNAVGALESEGTDFYLAASKLWLKGLGGYPLLVNTTLRSSQANQMGLLGFGGDLDSQNSLLWEVNASLLLKRNLVIGLEHRQKPDNLSFAKEDYWQDIYLAWFYDKAIAGVVAWTDLGSIAGLDDQQGIYFSIHATF